MTSIKMHSERTSVKMHSERTSIKMHSERTSIKMHSERTSIKMHSERTSIKMHSAESRFVIGPSNVLFGSLYVCTFQPRIFTGWGSEGVNITENKGGGGRKRIFDAVSPQ